MNVSSREVREYPTKSCSARPAAMKPHDKLARSCKSDFPIPLRHNKATSRATFNKYDYVRSLNVNWHENIVSRISILNPLTMSIFN